MSWPLLRYYLPFPRVHVTSTYTSIRGLRPTQCRLNHGPNGPLARAPEVQGAPLRKGFFCGECFFGLNLFCVMWLCCFHLLQTININTKITKLKWRYQLKNAISQQLTI